MADLGRFPDSGGHGERTLEPSPEFVYLGGGGGGTTTTTTTTKGSVVASPSTTRDRSSTASSIASSAYSSYAPSIFSSNSYINNSTGPDGRPLSFISTADSIPESDAWSSKDTTSRTTSPSRSPQQPGTTRSRRDRNQLYATRLQRSASAAAESAAAAAVAAAAAAGKTTPTKNEFKESPIARRFRAGTIGNGGGGGSVVDGQEGTSSAVAGDGSMAFSEQQRWVTVQQKTFTKW